MKLFLLAIAALAAFIAIWFFFVAPAERRHHERKLEMVRKRIERRESGEQMQDESTYNESEED